MSRGGTRRAASMWRRHEALKFLRDVVQPAVEPAGWHCALAGGVLFRGQSSHDLDVVIYPHNSERRDLDKLRAALETAGLFNSHSVERLHRIWRAKGSADRKHVEVWMWRGKRVDIVLPSETVPDDAVHRQPPRPASRGSSGIMEMLASDDQFPHYDGVALRAIAAAGLVDIIADRGVETGDRIEAISAALLLADKPEAQ